MGYKSDGDTDSNWCNRYNHQRTSTGTEELGNTRTSGDHPNNDIIENDQNTEESPGDLRTLAVTQTPVKNHQLKLVEKKNFHNNNNNNHLMYMVDIKPSAKTEKNLDILIKAVRIYNLYIGVKFGQEKFAKVIMKSDKKQMTERIEVPNKKKIGLHEEKEIYKYLGILETDTIKQAYIREKKIKKEFLRRTRKLLETKLYSRNILKEINTFADLLVRYSGLFLKWTREEIKQMEQRPKNLWRCIRPTSERWQRLYVLRKEEGRRPVSIQNSIEASTRRLEDYIKKSKKRRPVKTQTTQGSTKQ